MKSALVAGGLVLSICTAGFAESRPRLLSAHKSTQCHTTRIERPDNAALAITGCLTKTPLATQWWFWVGAVGVVMIVKHDDLARIAKWVTLWADDVMQKSNSVILRNFASRQLPVALHVEAKAAPGDTATTKEPAPEPTREEIAHAHAENFLRDLAPVQMANLEKALLSGDLRKIHDAEQKLKDAIAQISHDVDETNLKIVRDFGEAYKHPNANLVHVDTPEQVLDWYLTGLIR